MILGLTLTATSCNLFSSKTSATTDSLNVEVEDSLQVDSLATPIDSITEKVDSASNDASGVIEDTSKVKTEEPKAK